MFLYIIKKYNKCKLNKLKKYIYQLKDLKNIQYQILTYLNLGEQILNLSVIELETVPKGPVKIKLEVMLK